MKGAGHERRPKVVAARFRLMSKAGDLTSLGKDSGPRSRWPDEQRAANYHGEKRHKLLKLGSGEIPTGSFSELVL